MQTSELRIYTKCQEMTLLVPMMKTISEQIKGHDLWSIL